MVPRPYGFLPARRDPAAPRRQPGDLRDRVLVVAIALCVLLGTLGILAEVTYRSPHPGPSLLGGRELFQQQSCAACHPGVGPVLAHTRLSDAVIADTIRHGRPNTQMPAFDTLPDDEIAALILYIRALP